MAKQSREEYLRKKREYYHNNKEHFKKYWREHRKESQVHKDKYKAKLKREHPEEYKRKEREHYLAYSKRLRDETFRHYGNDEIRCAHCGESRLACLSIDHIAGGGNKHRKERKSGGGINFYSWLKRQGFPKGYQVLCMNCQWVKRVTNNEVMLSRTVS